MILILLNSRDCSYVFNMLDSEGLYVSQAVGGVEVSHDNGTWLCVRCFCAVDLSGVSNDAKPMLAVVINLKQFKNR